MSSRGASFKKGFGRASLAAQIAAESANELARVFSGMAQRYKRLAEQQDEVQWSVDSVERMSGRSKSFATKSETYSSALARRRAMLLHSLYSPHNAL